MNVFDPCSSWDGEPVYVANDGLCSDHSTCYSAIADAYNDSLNFREISIRAEFFPEDLTFAMPKVVVLSGGWDQDYSSNATGRSVIGGSLTITAGTVIVERIVIEGEATTLVQTDKALGFGRIARN